MGQHVEQNEIYGILNRTYDHGLHESKVHLTLYAGDELSDRMSEYLAPGSEDLSSYALPSTLLSTYNENIPLLIIYEGQASVL